MADGWLAPGCERAGVATGGVSRQVLWRGEQHLGCRKNFGFGILGFFGEQAGAMER